MLGNYEDKTFLIGEWWFDDDEEEEDEDEYEDEEDEDENDVVELDEFEV